MLCQRKRKEHASACRYRLAHRLCLRLDALCLLRAPRGHRLADARILQLLQQLRHLLARVTPWRAACLLAIDRRRLRGAHASGRSLWRLRCARGALLLQQRGDVVAQLRRDAARVLRLTGRLSAARPVLKCGFALALLLQVSTALSCP